MNLSNVQLDVNYIVTRCYKCTVKVGDMTIKVLESFPEFSLYCRLLTGCDKGFLCSYVLSKQCKRIYKKIK